MKKISIDISKVYGSVTREKVFSFEQKIQDCHTAILNKTGKGADFLGWVNLPSETDQSTIIEQLVQIAGSFKNKIDVKIMSSKENLQMLHYLNNLCKGIQCSIQLDELLFKTRYLLLN